MNTAVSLFSGCGGSDAGLVRAGFEILFANDILPYAHEVYLKNLPSTDYVLGPIETITSFPSADLLSGCYPCQGFSQGGARTANKKINYLYREFARALRIIQPKVFIVENVSGMLRSDFRHLLEDQIELFSACGYNVTSGLLNAADYGVPQERKRLFIVGIDSRIGIQFLFPQPTHGPGTDKPYRTIRDAISDLPEWPIGNFYDDKFHWYYMSRNRRRDWDEPSKTIVSHPRHMPLHPLSPPLIRVHTDKWIWQNAGPKRRFSYDEAARLQGFPKAFSLPETDKIRDKYRVVGNAVPPPLFEAVARQFKEVL